MSLPVFSQSFRICFLLAASWAVAVVPIWLAIYSGEIDLGSTYGASLWHAHELIFGYVALVIAGFLFTAIPNWTGRPPLGGWRLIALVVLWLVGRVAITCAAAIGLGAAAVVDNLFLVAVISFAAREILAGQNYRNLVVVTLVGLLLASNIWFHTDAILSAAHGAGGHVHQHMSASHTPLRAGLAVILALIVLIGGRIVPNFTRNWLARHGAARLPALPSRFDMIAALIGAGGLASWVFAPDAIFTGVLALISGLALLARLARWRGWETLREPLLAVLHFGYLFVPVGFLLIAGRLLLADAVLPDAELHAWTVGAVGVMTLAVMTRATLGHTGQKLTANIPTIVIYALILIAAALRTAAPLCPDYYLPLLSAAGAAWTCAFAGFVLVYGPLLVRLRAGG
jgi:uncharacterized protein involved in response to NO